MSNAAIQALPDVEEFMDRVLSQPKRKPQETRTMTKASLLLLLTLSVLIFSAGFWAGQRSRTQSNLAAYDQAYENGKQATWREIATCTVKEAHQELCVIPCASDEDCLAKNGMSDH